MTKKTWFERAIFLSWYCSRGDCKFCYMSTQKDKIKNPELAKRTKESIIAEVIISKATGWKIEFISGGYESYRFDEIVEIVKIISKIMGEKQWINIGVIKKEEFIKIKPYLKGFCGAIECVNKQIHDNVCPSKPIKEIEEMYSLCNNYNLKKAMTLIIGLGETINDFEKLKEFIIKNGIKKITFYSLNPQKGTEFNTSPKIEYYAEWVKKTRKEFPELQIITGAWINKPQYFEYLLKAGADAITKIPAIKYFGTKEAKLIEESIEKADRKFIGSLTKMPRVDWDKEVEKLELDSELKDKIKAKIKQYVKKMSQ